MTRTRLLVALAVVATLTSAAFAGELDPPAPPAPTMKSLDSIPGSWDRILPANDGPVVGGPADPCNSSRFKCVMGAAAVLDRETGLVWDREPSTQQFNWELARTICLLAYRGGRSGWRLPSIQELLSLADGGFPFALPAGHPFSASTSATSGWYWSNTTSGLNPDRAFVVAFGNAALTFEPKNTEAFCWCVRGGSGPDVQ